MVENVIGYQLLSLLQPQKQTRENYSKVLSRFCYQSSDYCNIASGIYKVAFYFYR